MLLLEKTHSVSITVGWKTTAPCMHSQQDWYLLFVPIRLDRIGKCKNFVRKVTKGYPIHTSGRTFNRSGLFRFTATTASRHNALLLEKSSFF